jgi:hypothetical protein
MMINKAIRRNQSLVITNVMKRMSFSTHRFNNMQQEDKSTTTTTEKQFTPIKIKQASSSPTQQQQQQSYSNQENIMKRNILTNTIYASGEEKAVVKRGVILSIAFSLLLLIATYYRSFYISRMRGTQWFPSYFIYANDENFIHIETYFGHARFAANPDTAETKEERIEQWRIIDEATKDVVEL